MLKIEEKNCTLSLFLFDFLFEWEKTWFLEPNQTAPPPPPPTPMLSHTPSHAELITPIDEGDSEGCIWQPLREDAAIFSSET